MTKVTDNNYIPKNYEDLYRYYILGNGKGNSLCHKILRSMLPYESQEERESLAQDVFLRCMEKDMLKVFDPAKSNFGGLIFFVTRSIIANYLASKSRNPVTGLNGGSLSDSEMEDGEFEPGMYSLDRLFGTETPNYETQMDAKALIEKIMDWAKALYEDPRHTRDKSLYPLLQLMATEADPRQCSKELGVTTSTIHNWLAVIKEKAQELKASA